MKEACLLNAFLIFTFLYQYHIRLVKATSRSDPTLRLQAIHNQIKREKERKQDIENV